MGVRRREMGDVGYLWDAAEMKAKRLTLNVLRWVEKQLV